MITGPIDVGTVTPDEVDAILAERAKMSGTQHEHSHMLGGYRSMYQLLHEKFNARKPASFDDWWWQAHTIGWLKTLCDSYETEHDFEDDEDTSATYEMLREVRGIHDKLLADLGDAPAQPETVPADPTMPF